MYIDVMRPTLALTLVLAMTSGCRQDPYAQTQPPPHLQQKLDDIQAHLVAISEQLDEIEPGATPMQTETPVILHQEPSREPVVRITDIEPAPPPQPPSKREVVASFGQEPPTTMVRRRSSAPTRTRASKKSGILTKKHLRVNGVSVRQIQAALKNADCNPGPVDNRMGPKTISAIKQFQAKEGLKVDGIVGSRTWGHLQRYL